MKPKRPLTQAPAPQVAHTLVYTYAVRDAFVKEAIRLLDLEGVVELTTDLDRATGVIATRAAVQVRGLNPDLKLPRRIRTKPLPPAYLTHSRWETLGPGESRGRWMDKGQRGARRAGRYQAAVAAVSNDE
jgi:hypothetical protein